MNLALKQFTARYLGFSVAKIALLIGKSVILILAFGWLSTAEFALLAATLSAIEILRPLSEIGAENIVYSRLGNANTALLRVIQKLFRLRIQVAGLISFVAIIGLVGFSHANIAPLFLLPLIAAIQNTNLALLQKNCAYRKISALTTFALCISAVSVFLAHLSHADSLLLSLLLICPEILACFVGVYLSRANWLLILSGFTRKKNGIKKLLPYMLPSIGIGIVVMIYSRLDIIYIRPVLGTQAQADFSVAFRLVDPIFLILSLASLTLLAELGSNTTSNAKDISLGLLKKMGAFFYVILFGLFITLAFTLYYFSMHVLDFTQEAATLLIIITLTIPIKLINTFYSSLLQRAGRFNLIFNAAIITLISTFTFAIPFGMFYGVMGVAAAATVAEIINMAYQKMLVRKLIGNF